ncbi:MAG: PIN domain-containing protein [Oscillospiraceae bacterium]|nr:PIN domain-containing protein [Oscillospiraceae bacterium]
MNGKAFLDTNILVYFYSESEKDKQNTALSVLNRHECVTNIHAVCEASNVFMKKFKWNPTKVKKHLDNIELVCDEILPVQRNTINKAIDIKDRYGFSFYDCLMLASALESDCQMIFTEDMSDGQIINDTLKIINPFAL